VVSKPAKELEIGRFAESRRTTHAYSKFELRDRAAAPHRRIVPHHDFLLLGSPDRLFVPNRAAPRQDVGDDAVAEFENLFGQPLGAVNLDLQAAEGLKPRGK